MSLLLPALALLLHIVLVLLAAPLLLVALDGARERRAGHRPPPLRAQLREEFALLRRPPALPEGVSPVFRHAPLVRLAALLAAAVLVPGFTTATALAPGADLLLLAGLFALARATEICAGLDAGTPRAGHAALLLQRRALWIAPALLLAIFVLATLADASTRLDAVIAAIHDATPALLPSVLLALAALALVALADCDRAPFADPAAPLDATAWQESYAGRDQAVIRLGTALRLLAWLGLLAALAPVPAVPVHALVDWPLAILAWGVKLTVLAAALLAVEAGRARLRPGWEGAGREGEGLGAASLLGLLALVSLLALAGRA